jgi:hypothetical protein
MAKIAGIEIFNIFAPDINNQKILELWRIKLIRTHVLVAAHVRANALKMQLRRVLLTQSIPICV